MTTNTSSAAIDSASGVNRNKELANLKAKKEYQVTIAADEETTEILAEVQKIRGNKESLGALLKAVLKEYVDRHAPEAKESQRKERVARKENAATKEPATERQVTEELLKADSKPEQAKVTRHIPEAVKDTVRIRDGYQCSYVSPAGVRCQATKQLQYDHIYPFGKGGNHDVENIRLLCPQHNRLMAERCYGKEFVALKIGNKNW